VHIGHLVVAAHAVHALGLDRMLFVPAGRPWQKEHFSDAEDRYMMASLAAEMHPAFGVSRMELDRKGPTYTVDTLRGLRDFYGERAVIYLVVGSDVAAGMSTWHASEQIWDLAKVVVATRPGADPIADARAVALDDGPVLDVSARDLRRRIAAGIPVDFLVPRRVAEFIRMRGLYVGEGRERG
jgi:nicotinate-nucleotide adenylyltransferase